jgi:SAM-dependent methyltransferase
MNNSKLAPLSFYGGNFNVVDKDKFFQAMKLLNESVFDSGATIFCSDNLITWNKNYSFLRDGNFTKKLENPHTSSHEKSIVWRTYILLFFAKIASRVSGDFLELGCHTGSTAMDVIKNIDFVNLKKQYYLYDLFEWNEGDEHTQFEGHKNPNMYSDIVAKFSSESYVHIIKGPVPEVLLNESPLKIAFAHIDMNHPVPEQGALLHILPKLTPGGIIIFDDYGWWGYSAQKIAIDEVLKHHSLSVLELPTGQGILINS